MSPPEDRATAQEAADRLRVMRQELLSGEVRSVLQLTPEQSARFEEWSRARLAALAQKFDIDTTASQERASWGMRIASTFGGLALCAAVVLLFTRYWGYLDTPLQLAFVTAAPLVLLAGAEFASRRETATYFTGLLALVALASFILNLAVAGSIFNLVSNERALLAWGTFAMVLAYRYSLRLMLAAGLLLLISYAAAAVTAGMGYRWLEFYDRPEYFLAFGLLTFAIPLFGRHERHSDFPSVYRLTGALAFFVTVLWLSSWGAFSYLPWDAVTIERFYEFAGLLFSAGAIWWGIARNWNGVVNTGAVFFIIFLFIRLYRWWWDTLPRYLFFAIIGALGIALVWAFKRVRGRMSRVETEALP